MNKVSEELGSLLGDKDRDFKEDPITVEESHALILKLHEMVGDPNISDDLASFYITCLKVVKENTVYQ